MISREHSPLRTMHLVECCILYMPKATSNTFEQICAMSLASSALARLMAMCEPMQ